MNCPYCNKEMQKGFMKSHHPILWGEEKTLSFLKTYNDYVLTKNDFHSVMRGMFIESYYCNDCHKQIGRAHV